MTLRHTFVLLFLTPCLLFAQTPNIKPYLVQIANGYSAEAKKALPDLLLDHPDDPAVMFLHASLVEEPKRALPLLERIASAYPKSEWCDDALLRIIYYAIGTKEVDRARKTFAQLRDQHSASELIPIAYDAMRMTIGAPPPADKAPTVAAKTATPAKVEPTPPAKPWVIQVTSTTNKATADAMINKLKAKRVRARLNTTTKSGKDSYSVLVGEYASSEEAQKEVADVKAACKCSPSVVKQ